MIRVGDQREEVRAVHVDEIDVIATFEADVCQAEKPAIDDGRDAGRLRSLGEVAL